MKQDYDLLCLSHLEWDTRLFQRPQQLMQRLSSRHRVLFCCEVPTKFFFSNYFLPSGKRDLVLFHPNENLTISKLPYLPYVKNNLTVINWDYRFFVRLARWRKKVAKFETPVLWIYSPLMVPAVGLMEESLVVYDCMDNHAAFLEANPHTREKESELLSKADVVFTGGKSLHEAKIGLHDNLHCFPSGVDYDHFHTAMDPATPIPDDIKEVLFQKKPILGYFGAIDERLDYPLLEGLAEARPDWSIVLLGPVFKINPAKFFSKKNVYYLGRKEYKDLPAYTKAFDICLLPFARTDLTLKTSPTKTPEYLAAGKPMVSTPIPDVIKDYSEVVEIEADLEGFIQAIEKSLEPASEAIIQKRLQAAKDKSWESIAEAMDEMVLKTLERKMKN